MHSRSLQSCPTLWDPVDYSLLGSSVHGILQAKVLEWVAMPSSSRIFLIQGSNLRLLCHWHWQAGFFLPTSATWDWVQFCPWHTCTISCPLLPSSTALGYFSPFLSHSAQLPRQPSCAVCIPPVPIHEKNSISKIHALPGLLGTGLPSPWDACQATTGTKAAATSPASPQHRMTRALWAWHFQNRTVPVTST